MFQHLKIRLNLRKLILLLAIASVVITLLNALYSIYKVEGDLIVENTLESNKVYSEKMAQMTDTFIASAQSQLKYASSTLSSRMNDEFYLQQETNRLRQQTQTFNSVVVVNALGKIISVSPETIQIKGIQVSSDNALQSLTEKKPLVTNPFISIAGNYLISISHPIFSPTGTYLGYVAGTIYLEQKNILSTILGKHSYADGTYLYVVDRNKTIIYHPDVDKIGQTVEVNQAVNTVDTGTAGALELVDSSGTHMLAGFSPVSSSGWGVIVQRDRLVTLAELNQQILNVIKELIPVVLVTFIFIWVSAIFISKPLWQLASAVKSFEQQGNTKNDLNHINPWYFEVAHLKSTLVKAFSIMSTTINQLHNDSHTDSMTGLLNRRGLDQAMKSLTLYDVPFSVLEVDVDYFKQVNDTFGHDAGDELIKAISYAMQEEARQEDVVCRYGGEEFLLFLANTNLEVATNIAERLRNKIEQHTFPTVGHITVSAGLSHWPGQPVKIEDVIKKADEALYQAKRNGRNQVQVN
ncbi:sensor domain-containing diguanylate cyclase [Vibrio sp. TH_r3]|uniref:sensor domain-containing diguanylate cyclase n=1 Tax=Vibrio sp. TH_r3 TaxID=3082084 RepID=UPI0029543BA8|nr:sensor domain-containing diguanylate cyclase [Vibrio sp. TH_r3]MDV7103646.1 sensor domain-containing diguanylate cyclase [Vibrio sp. TH_r3]